MAQPATPTQPKTSNALINKLRDVMANVFVLYYASHRAHWNVTGSDFAQYHALFLEIYEDIYSSIDPFAENIRKLKSKPYDLLGIVEKSTIDDDAIVVSTQGLATDLKKKNATVIVMLKDAFDVATSCREQGIANFIAERIDAHMKIDWQLTASTEG